MTAIATRAAWRPLRLHPLRTLIVVAGALMVLASCGSGDEGVVADAVQRSVDSYNQKDAAGFISMFTDKAVQEQYGVPREAAVTALANSIGEPPIELRRLSNAHIDGEAATVDFEHTAGKVVVLEQVSLVKEGEQWKIDAFKSLPLDIPDGVTAVSVEATEFTFKLDSEKIKDGDIALAVHNSGQQEHELVLARITAGVPIEQIVAAIAQAGKQAQNAPAGVEEIVAFGAYKPGDSGNIVLANPLAPGRYGMFCFFPDVNDPEQTPHALKGMYSEFAVPG
jgi:hypothetical protein